MEFVGEVVDREAERLSRRSDRLREAAEALRNRYPTAAEVAAEVEQIVGVDEALAERLQQRDWTGEFEEVADQIDELLGDRERSASPVLHWSGDYGLFCQATTDPMWRIRQSRSCVDVARIVDEVIGDVALVELREQDVGYPILFTHQVEANQRAVARVIGWSLVLRAIIAWMDEAEDVTAVRIVGGPEEIRLMPDAELSVDQVPEAEAFGFVARGDLFRRLEDFDQVDPGAHWTRWMEGRRRGARELRELREQGGARLRVELDRPLKRLRIIEQPRSTVVRKRHHVFVDAHATRCRDHYFATEEDLDTAIEEHLRERVDDGFRIVYQQVGSP